MGSRNMRRPTTLLDWTSNDLETLKSKSIRFRRFVSRKGVDLNHIPLLESNGKPCVKRPHVAKDSRLVTLMVQVQSHYVSSLYMSDRSRV